MERVNPVDKSFSQIPEILSQIKAANPGTVTELATAASEQGSHHFKHVFISHGASQDGFPFQRNLIVVSGAHLRRNKPLFLIVAVSQDANFQTFPLAFAVVDSQSDQSWRWFLRHLEQCFSDSKQLTVLSDGGAMVSRALTACYPEAHHVDCLRRLQLSVHLYFKVNALKSLVREAACAHTAVAFRRSFNKIKEVNPDCADYLQVVGFPRWTSYYQAGDRFNIMTAGIAQGFIHSLLPQTVGPISNLLHCYHTTAMLWFRARLHAAMDHTGVLKPGVQSYMDRISTTKSQWKVIIKSSGTCEVISTQGEIQFVSPLRRSCSCKVFNKLRIPCVHAMVASESLGVSAEALVHHCYTSVAWFESYITQLHRYQELPNAETITQVFPELLPPSTSSIAGSPTATIRMPM
ncbi:uncharacterized protein LOC18025639 [Eutrema salsugineum]|uniref:uncharacterized protein LOC18025639 n=1 Tax=Eutrema salsugineum TaxID=72664 RepID=UPI000CECE845|nr:uncharacterized protein LOC18025639 [Eutrema salsugineum]